MAPVPIALTPPGELVRRRIGLWVWEVEHPPLQAQEGFP